MKAIALALSVLLALAGCGSDHTMLNNRATEWKSKTDAGLPAGRSIEEAKSWAVRNGITFSHLEQQRQLYAVVEVVPEAGLNKYVCSEWSFILKVHLTESGKTKGNEVSTIGTCL